MLPNFSSFNNVNLNLWQRAREATSSSTKAEAKRVCCDRITHVALSLDARPFLRQPEWWIHLTAGTFISIKTISYICKLERHKARPATLASQIQERQDIWQFSVLVFAFWFILSSSLLGSILLLHVLLDSASTCRFFMLGLSDSTVASKKKREIDDARGLQLSLSSEVKLRAWLKAKLSPWLWEI